MSYRDYLPGIIRHNRESMRYSALMYRKARARGDVGFMIKWLSHAVTLRILCSSYHEYE